MQSSIEFASSKFASCVRDSIVLMKSKLERATSPSEATSGQGLPSGSGVSHRDVQSGSVVSQELCEVAGPDAVVGGQPDFGRVAPQPQLVSARFARYGIRGLLGQGASGTVVLADDAKNGGKVAIKAMKRPKPGSNTFQHNLKNEFNILRHFSNMPLGRVLVTELKDSFVDAYNYYLAMEYCPGGTLLDVMNEFGRLMPSKLVKFYAAELITTATFLHANGIVHRDIKPENLLINSEGHIVVSDFGLAHLAYKGSPTMYVGTPGYIAPEVYLKTQKMFESDMWSVGCVIYEMFYGQKPFSSPAETVKGDLAFPDFRPIDHALKDLICKLLDRDQGKRPTAMGASSHAFFRDMNMFNVLLRKVAAPAKILMHEEPARGVFFSPEIFEHPDLAFYHWPTQSPQDFEFFTGPLEEGDIPRVELCHLAEDGSCGCSQSPPRIPTIVVTEAPVLLARERVPSGQTSGETMVAPSAPASPTPTVAGTSSEALLCCKEGKSVSCMEVV